MKDKAFFPDEVTAGTIGAFVGLTGERVRQLGSEGVFPAPGKGKFPLRETVLAIVMELRSRLKGKSPELADAKQRKEIAEADGAEIDTAKKSSEVVSADDVRLIWMDRALEVRRVVESRDYLKPAQKTKLIADIGKIPAASMKESGQ